jgi:branched-chain amino acid aminotransferase
MNFLNYNGELYPVESLIFGIENRAFRYNDSVFETMRVANGRVLWLAEHAKRLCESLEIMQLNLRAQLNLGINDVFNAASVATWIQQEVGKTLKDPFANARTRLTVFREEGGFYTPFGNNVHFVIKSEPLPPANYPVAQQGLTVGVAESVVLPTFSVQSLPLQTVKNTLSAWYIQANIERKTNGWDEILLKNAQGCFIDGGSSAIVLVKNGELFVSSEKNSTIKSIMQTVLLKKAAENNFSIKKTAFFAKDLAQADQIILCNVIKGIHLVEKLLLDGKIYHYSQKNETIYRINSLF